MKRKVLPLLMGLFLTGAPVLAQSLEGVVRDENGDPLLRAQVHVESLSVSTLTDANGHYEITDLPQETIQVEVKMLGYATQVTEVTIRKGSTRLNFALNRSVEQLTEVSVNAARARYMTTEPSLSLRVKTPLIAQPQNIQVVQKQTLWDQGSVDMLEAVTRNVSGAQMVEHWGNFARINMRGFKIPAFRNGMNVDMPWGPLTEDMAIVDRIEFVKGPAGFMLTAGEPGGFYNVVTKKPTDNPTNSVDFMFGSFNQLRTAVDVGGDFQNDGNLQYRLNVMASSRGTHRDFEFNDRLTIAPSLRYKISDKTELNAEYIYQHSTLSVIGAAYVFSTRGYGSLPRDYTLGEPNIDPTNIDEHNAFISLKHELNDRWDFNAQLGYVNYTQIGSSLWAASVSDAGVQRTLSVWDALNTAYLGQAYLRGEERTGSVVHRITTGIDFSRKEYFADWFQSGALGDTLDYDNPVHSVPTSEIPVFDRSRSIRQRAYGSYFAGVSIASTALYFQDEMGFWEDRIRFTLGGRLTSFDEARYGATVNNLAFTPRIGLNAEITKNIHAFGLFDESFAPQSGADSDGNGFDPVRARDLEGGLKTRWMDGKWTASAGYFHITKRNVLTADPDNPMFSIQLGEVVSRGFEVDIQGEILPGLHAVLNYANTNVTITEDTDESMIGARVAGHAEHSTNGWLTYRFNQQSTLNGFYLSSGYQYQVNRSSWSWDTDNEFALPNYFRWDAALGWSNEKFTVHLLVNNLLNDYLYSGSGYATYVYWQSEPGTNFRLNFQYRF